MNTVTVSASKNYNVCIGNVWPIYGQAATDSLVASGFDVEHYIFPAGEASKNGQIYLEILNELATNHLTRSDLLVALGGGVVGDMTGFVAATYLRGISFIQVPTTLLAMVDSSVGGKTAIDLPAGKNLVGAFYQPELVICDLNTLHTLPDSVFADGCAEVIKYSVLFDADLFSHLEDQGLRFDREYVISRCISLKAEVVCADEFDKGLRQQLNLGHTIGHSIEKNSNFTITHGQAVAIGMAIIAKAGIAANFTNADTYTRITNLLEMFRLPTQASLTAEQIASAALSDKKRAGSVIQLVLPRTIGECFLHPLPVTDLISFIERGL